MSIICLWLFGIGSSEVLKKADYKYFLEFVRIIGLLLQALE